MSALADELVSLPHIGGRHSLRREIADALRAALVAGKMRPGVIYSAPALAEKFGVSPTPVREAMIDLVNDGLIEAIRYRGFRVVPLSARDLDELIEMRELIEIPAVARLAGSVTDEVAARLRTLADEVLAAAREGDLLGYTDADRRFHAELLTLNGNRVLAQTAHDLCNRARLYGLATPPDSAELIACALEHGRLVEALVRGETGKAEESMRRHLGHVRNWARRGRTR